ncbi:MAG: HPF/RaiA family ribosome-associated protein [Proteobacteria bacterium]|nr:HPF/RaiA family ribosome-associated protein [Pseudomonadota bacterium]
MQVEPEISFHRCEPSDAIKDAIGRHIEHLEKIFDRITACRVRIDQLNQNAAGTMPPVVRIEIAIPGQKDIVVAHETAHLQRKFQSPDVRNAVNEAFRIAGQRLAQAKDMIGDRRQVQRA